MTSSRDIANLTKPDRQIRITFRDKLTECRRELGLRRRVYAKWVAAGRMKQHDADWKIAVLEAIADDYETAIAKREPELPGLG